MGNATGNPAEAGGGGPRHGGLASVAALGLVLTGLLVLASFVLAGCGSSSGAGKKAPDFSGKTIDGVEVSLAGYRGMPLVLAFMGSW